ncbi:hypothetical protein R1flu_026904 [Riccia fluitans]|uniref:Uncharacterized protein n=1 Tax=Riccia fluitans TaxID=41844 RepID=A0ABD1XHB6_9MARC
MPDSVACSQDECIFFKNLRLLGQGTGYNSRAWVFGHLQCTLEKSGVLVPQLNKSSSVLLRNRKFPWYPE